MSEKNCKSEQYFISKCLIDIEQKLEWGQISSWSNYDYEKLSDEIQKKTGVNLSVTTLKRVSGRLKYPHAPSSTTLNTLAEFVEFKDWREYKQQKKLEIAPPLEDRVLSEQKTPHKPWIRYVLSSFFVLVLLLGVIIHYSFRNNLKKSISYNPDDFEFSLNKVHTQGVPNSVIFSYDASKAESDSIFIAQTWDVSRKTLVAKDGNKHSAIYYYPGFFRTKLMVDNQIVKTKDLQISSDGWLGLVELENKPIYFKKSEILKSEEVAIDKELIQKYNIDLSPEAPGIRFFNQRDLGDLMNDNFIFETELKNPYSEGNNACQYVEVLIQCKDDIIIIPLCSEACVGEALLYAAGEERTSKNSDLSGFGADLKQWTNLRVETVNKKMTFYVNNKEADSFIFPHEATGIVGVQYRFYGLGAVKYARFKQGTHTIDLD